MKIMAINAGSSSLKFTLIELPEEKTIASGNFERIGLDKSFYSFKFDGKKIEKEVDLKDHSVAVSILMEEFVNLGIIKSLDEIDGVGHRVVHGGDEFNKSVVLNEEVITRMKKFTNLAPLHNPANLMGIEAFMSKLPNIINVAVFDTAFHATMEEENYLYPVPYEWYTNHHVRKYGFHGTSHKYVNKVICDKLDNNDLKVITCHIGNGASLAAIEGGKVVDTSMGLTPLAGVMMGTRSGDIDPSIIEYMCKETGKTVSEITNDLNKQSGLHAISGVGSDARDLEKGATEGNERCILAQKMFAQRIANYIAMYNNKLNGADVILFTAGIGEKSSLLRKYTVEKIKSLGINLDEEGNKVFGEFGKISTDDSKIPVYVVPTNEELMIALEVMELK